MKEIAEKQSCASHFCIVGLATRDQRYYYKKEMYAKTKPEVLLLGSSRVMPFRSSFFSHRMYNAGGAMNDVNEGFSFVKEAFAIHVPKVIVIGIDFWWFNPSVVKPSTVIQAPREKSPRISLRSYLLPYKWLWQSKITMKEYLERLNPFYRFRNSEGGIGVDGALNQNGFGPDGSYFYTKYVTGKDKPPDPHLRSYTDYVENNNVLFGREAKINDIHFDNFLAMLSFIKKHNVKIVLFFPPLAPLVANKIGNYSLMNELREKLTVAKEVYYDFHHPGFLSTSDCEFIDGIHGGDLLYAKMLSYIGKRDAFLSPFLNDRYLHRVTRQFSNIAMIPRKDITSKNEVDFLDLSCNKPSDPHHVV